jgi:hypothetical protein
MQAKVNHIAQKRSQSARKRALAQSILNRAFWSYPRVAPSKVPDGKLIEKVLVHGDDGQRKELLNIFPVKKVMRVWEQRLIIQEPRLHHLNRRLAVELFHLPHPEDHIKRSYRKYNLYDRFSAKNA